MSYSAMCYLAFKLSCASCRPKATHFIGALKLNWRASVANKTYIGLRN